MKRVPVVFFGLCMAAVSVLAQNAEKSGKSTAPGFTEEFLIQLEDVEKKMVGLAEAMPAESYSWRPAEGVRSVSELFVHTSGANVFFCSMAGVKMPEGFSRDAEKTVMEKGKVVELLKKSFAHVRKAAEGVEEADLAKPAKFPGRETTVGGVYFFLANHMHEHVGQAVAYARMNGVTPPWSVKEK